MIEKANLALKIPVTTGIFSVIYGKRLLFALNG
jgi:hypothetical protein